MTRQKRISPVTSPHRSSPNSQVPIIQQIQTNASRRSRPFIDVPVRWRLAIGFLIAALITSLAVGITGSQQVQTLDVESDFYQSLIQDNTDLFTADSYLQLLNPKGHELLGELTAPYPSQETIETDRNALQGLMSRYNRILTGYIQQNLLDQHPDQLALLSKAGHPVQVALQRRTGKHTHSDHGTR